jgi:Mycothiol maleylpyruvate isomerase N-terminal domain
MVKHVTGDDVLTAAGHVRRVLEPTLERNWRVAIPGLEFTVTSVVAHVCVACLWYSVDMWSGSDNGAFEVSAVDDAPNERLLTSLVAGAHVLSAGIDGAPPTLRGFHPFGSPDPDGFAAMACDELLVHGDDAARGLGEPFAPDDRLAASVLARLFPWHHVDAGETAWDVLRWANGRIELPGRPRVGRWRWHCAPLREWDGTAP